MSSEPQAGNPMALHSNMVGCQCASCRPFPPNTPGFIDTRPPHGPKSAPPTVVPIDADWCMDLMLKAHSRACRAADKLRAQRKRHAQRLAALQAQLDEVQARLDRAMEIVQYVAVGDHIRDWGADARVTILERINKQAQTLVAQEKVRKQA